MPERALDEKETAAALLAEAWRGLDLAKAAGAEDAACTVTRRRGTEFEWRDERLEKVQEDRSRALSISLYVDGRYSTHVTHDLDPERLRAFVAEAVALTRQLEADPHRRIPDPALYADRPPAELDLVDPSLAELDRDTRAGWCRALADAARGDPSVISATASVADAHEALARATTNGFEGTEESTAVFYGAVVTIRDGETKRPEAHRYVGGTHLEGLPAPEAVGREALDRALAHRGARKVDSRKTTMVVHPEAGPALVGRLVGALTAGAVQQRRSFLAERRGARIASPVLCMTDDPLVPRGLGSRTFDGEGISAKRLPLVEDGVLTAFLVDTYYGRKLGWNPTTGSPSNLVFRLGDADLETLLARVDDGILVTSWLGGNANLTTGDFSFGVRGHRVRGGARTEPISEMNVTGTYVELLDRLVRVGNDPIPWSTCRTPTLVFDGIQFSGS